MDFTPTASAFHMAPKYQISAYMGNVRRVIDDLANSQHIIISLFASLTPTVIRGRVNVRLTCYRQWTTTSTCHTSILRTWMTGQHRTFSQHGCLSYECSRGSVARRKSHSGGVVCSGTIDSVNRWSASLLVGQISTHSILLSSK